MAAENGKDCTANGKEPATVAKIKPSSVIREYRIVMPLTTEEYHVGQLYGVAEASKNETGGGEGIEVVENRAITEEELDLLPFKHQLQKREDGTIGGQYTHKRFYLASKVPMIVRALAPTGSLELDEKAWNCYPYCRTEYSNAYMADAFHLIIETMHKDDDGTDENAHDLNQAELIKRQVIKIDIANDPCQPNDYKDDEDPVKFHSEKTGRGPLVTKDWATTHSPVMCCYKLYRILFKWRMLQDKVESKIVSTVRRVLFNFHRQVFCWLDKWHGMTIEDIRALEAKTKADLEELRKTGEVRGLIQK